jgi:DnaK suppressor protein
VDSFKQKALLDLLLHGNRDEIVSSVTFRGDDAHWILLSSSSIQKLSIPKRLRKTTMKASELQRYKALLLDKREKLLAEFDSKDLAPAARASEGDTMDQARADTEADIQISVRQVDKQTLREVEAALARINRGTFGVCEICQQPLSEARLEAAPWSPICRKCKEAIA